MSSTTCIGSKFDLISRVLSVKFHRFTIEALEREHIVSYTVESTLSYLSRGDLKLFLEFSKDDSTKSELFPSVYTFYFTFCMKPIWY